MNIHKEEDIICIEPTNKCWEVRPDGTLTLFPIEEADKIYTYKAHDNFYIHSGQEEYISYMTVAPDGRLIEVNRFLAIHKNPGIKRTNGTKG